MKELKLVLVGLSAAFALTATLLAQTIFVPGGTTGTSSNGNVGIGTASPLGTLDIHKIGGSTLVMTSATANVSYTTTLVDDGANYYTAIGEGSAANAPITFYNPTSASPVAQIQLRNLGGNWNSLMVGHNDTYGELQTTSATPLALQPTGGNVGIGTTSPTASLHVRSATGNDTPIVVESQTHNSYITLRNLGGDNSLSSSDNALYIGGGGVPGPIYFRNGWTANMAMTATGNVGIGTTSPTQKLSVNGTIQAKEVIVQTGWSDYVFKLGYHLASLSEIEGAIKKEGHLPGIPSAQEVAEHGVGMGEMQSKLLAKVEELTLHLIEQEKLLHAQHDEINQLKAQLSHLNQSN